MHKISHTIYNTTSWIESTTVLLAASRSLKSAWRITSIAIPLYCCWSSPPFHGLTSFNSQLPQNLQRSNHFPATLIVVQWCTLWHVGAVLRSAKIIIIRSLSKVVKLLTCANLQELFLYSMLMLHSTPQQSLHSGFRGFLCLRCALCTVIT